MLQEDCILRKLKQKIDAILLLYPLSSVENILYFFLFFLNSTPNEDESLNAC